MFCCQFKNTIQSGNTNYELLQVIGTGSYGKVQLAKNLVTKQKCAIKLVKIVLMKIEKAKMEKYHAENNILAEIRIQSQLRHPNIVQLLEYFEDDEFIYLVQEYCADGTLRQHKLGEHQIFSVFNQLVEAIIYLHRQKIVHRDLKLDNILFNESVIKLTDFNWAAKITNYAEPSFCGTTHYMPPEIILLQPHNEKVDCWSLGVILYELVFRKRPFEGLTQEELQKQIIYHNPLAECNSIPTDLAMLLQALLTKNPAYRISSDQIKLSQWFQRHYFNKQMDESINLTNITYNKNDNI